MKPKKLILLILLFAFIGIGLTLLTYSFFVVDTIRIIPMEIEVHPTSFGINGDTDVLRFGRVASFVGAYSTKFLKISNNEKHSSFVTVSFSGDMASWTKVMENNFVLEPDEVKELEFRAYPPVNITPGNYTGKARIVIKRYWH